MRGLSLPAVLTAATLAAAAVTSAGLSGAGSAQATPVGPPSTLAGSRPSWAVPGADRGAVAGTARVTAQVYLAPRGGEAALDAFDTAVSTPGSPQYGHVLTAAEFHARFDPTAATVASVTRSLTASGLRVTGVERFHTYLSVSGTAAAAEGAFGTTLRRYRHGGITVQAPATDLRVAGSIGALVLGVTGLDTAPVPKRPASALPPPDTGYETATPCSAYSGQLTATYEGDFSTKLPLFEGKRLSYAVCGYVPSQLRGAYGVETVKGTIPHDGHGQTIAIVDAYASPTMLADADTYATRHGDPAFTPGQFTQSLPARYTSIGSCGGSGWYGEETLDVEAAHAMAPGADIRYYGSGSCNDPQFEQTLRRVVDDDTASIVSNSWAGLEYQEDAGAVVAYESVFKQGAAEGIGFDFSSGDDGDEVDDGGFRAVDYPSSDPWVTAVGGTTTGIGAANNRIFQTGWGTGESTLTKNTVTKVNSWTAPQYLYGSGGGSSVLFPRPSYQSGVVPNADSGSRAVPDIAADADPQTGMLVGQTQTFGHLVRYGEYRIGGTSLASPLAAGMLADVQQGLGSRLGFLNPLAYSLTRSRTGAFTDVRGPRSSRRIPVGVVRVDFRDQTRFAPAKGYDYTVRTFGDDGTLATVRGWDDTTGVGTPNVPTFIARAREVRAASSR
jgi:subtilase family serine protease